MVLSNCASAPPSRPARRGERGDRFIEARERARAGRGHGRLVVLDLARVNHAAHGEQTVHGRGREPGLDGGSAGGDGDRLRAPRDRCAPQPSPPRAARKDWRSRSRAPAPWRAVRAPRLPPDRRARACASRMSRPLALTLLSSNVHRHAPPLPPARANPVMLLTDIGQNPPSRSNRKSLEPQVPRTAGVRCRWNFGHQSARRAALVGSY